MEGKSVEERLSHLEIQMKNVFDKNAEMYEAFCLARNGIRMIGKIGDGVMKVSDTVEKRPKTLLVLGVLSAGGYSFITSGKLPDWIMSVVRVLIS